MRGSVIAQRGEYRADATAWAPGAGGIHSAVPSAPTLSFADPFMDLELRGRAEWIETTHPTIPCTDPDSRANTRQQPDPSKDSMARRRQHVRSQQLRSALRMAISRNHRV